MTILGRCVVYLVYCVLQLAVSYPATHPVLTICDRDSYIAYDTEGYGQIVSPKENSSQKPPCILKIVACTRCRIQLNFTELLSGSAIGHNNTTEECNYLLVSEPGYSELYRCVSPLNTVTGSVYLSETRAVSVRYCGPIETDGPTFNINFRIMEKENSFHGQYPDSGFFTSLGFPYAYGPNGDTFVYRIFNDNPAGFIKLSFDDWHLSSLCRVRIILAKSEVSVIGANSRPFVMSDGPNMTVEVMFATNAVSHSGFKARYEFVNSVHWPEKPTIVEEFYYDSRFGDELLCNCQKYNRNGLADFLWVIPRSSLVANVSSSVLMLRLQQPTLQSGDTLEIHRGNSSLGELLAWGSPRDYLEASGVYIRLRMRCSPYRTFQAVFAWVQLPSSGSLSSSTRCTVPFGFTCANTGYCLSNALVCDGIDHCGDKSDEINCQSAPTVTERVPRDCYAYFRCRNDRRTICELKRCNGIDDCSDGSDEYGCDGYRQSDDVDDDPYRNYTRLAMVIPLVIGTVITLVIVLAVVGFALQHRRHRAAVNRVREMVRERSMLRSPATDNAEENLTSGFSDCENDVSGLSRHLVVPGPVVMTPPSYEDTVTYNNVGSVSDAPPAYTEVAEHDEQHSASKNAVSDEEVGVLPMIPPAYTAVTGGNDDRFAFQLQAVSDGGVNVPSDADISDSGR